MTDGPPEIREVDWSQAHFLDHSIWKCGRRPEFQTGGRRRHLAYAWDLVWKPQLKAWTFCRLGRHSPGRVWAGTGPTAFMFIACRNCAKRLNRT